MHVIQGQSLESRLSQYRFFVSNLISRQSRAGLHYRTDQKGSCLYITSVHDFVLGWLGLVSRLHQFLSFFHTLRTKSTSVHLFWYFSLPQIGDLYQQPLSGRAAIGISFVNLAPNISIVVLPSTGTRPLFVTS